MLPVVQVGPLALQLPGLVVLFSLWLGLSLAEKYAPGRGVRADKLYNLVFAGLVAGVLGARLAFAGRHPDAFLASPASLISLNPGLLDPAGGALIGLSAMFLYGQKKALRLWPVLDALTPLIAVLLAGNALANLFSGDAYGMPADLPWAMQMWGEARHPSQVYEAAAAAAVLALFWPGRPANRKSTEGEYFLRFVILTAFVRLFLEGFRGDSAVLASGIRLVQVGAWLCASLGLALMWRAKFREG